MYRVTINDAGQKVCSRVHTREEFLALIDSAQNKSACQAALKGDANGKRRQVQICAQCNPAHNNFVLAGSKQYPTSHLMLDVDYDTAAPGWEQQKEEDTQRILAAKEEHGVLFVQATRKGLHIIMRRHDATQPQSENLRLAAQKIGVAADMCAKDITRVFFCGDSSTLLYLHDDVFAVEDCPYIPEEEEAKSAKPKPNAKHSLLSPANTFRTTSARNTKELHSDGRSWRHVFGSRTAARPQRDAETRVPCRLPNSWHTSPPTPSCSPRTSLPMTASRKRKRCSA